MRKNARSALEDLRLAIHGVTAPFSCEGTFDPGEPVTLVFRDGSRFAVTRAKDEYGQREALGPLIKHCKPAPFGAGNVTRYDRAVRDAMQLMAEHGGFSVEGFDPESDGILKRIQRQLLPRDPNPITAELYSLNVYTEGGHFAPHKDTPRGDGMFGTLVVCLPARFHNGNLVLCHRGVIQKHKWSAAIEEQKSPTQLHWTAFFGDVNHQIERIWNGVRVTLTYLLRRGEGSEPMREVSQDLEPHIQQAWRALLADRSFLPIGGLLGYPCCHLYHKDARFQSKQVSINQRSLAMLKGRDQLVAATALQSGLKVRFNPYMFETSTAETWQLARFPTAVEKSRLGRQMDSSALESSLPIRASSEKEGSFGLTWLEPPPSIDELTWQSRETSDPELPAASLLHSCDYCPWGYFGNESSEIDLYTFAALHIEIPKYGQDPRVAISTKVPRKRSTRKGNTERE